MVSPQTNKLNLLLSIFSTVYSAPTNQGVLESRFNNGLPITPPMRYAPARFSSIHTNKNRWNSYNHYNCYPNESIIHSNAQALIDMGLKSKGYHYVTVDCGWLIPKRTSEGKLPWNLTLFLSGYPALGSFLHGLGLGFGVYSDAGINMCGLAEEASLCEYISSTYP
jgi:alpha-galactosidase